MAKCVHYPFGIPPLLSEVFLCERCGGVRLQIHRETEEGIGWWTRNEGDMAVIAIYPKRAILELES